VRFERLDGGTAAARAPVRSMNAATCHSAWILAAARLGSQALGAL